CLYDVAMHQLTYPGVWYLNEADVSPRVPRSAHLSLAPVQTFPTQDGWIFVMCMTQKFWLALVEAMDRRDLLADPRFADPNTRAADRGARRDLPHAHDRRVARQVQRPVARGAGSSARPGARQRFCPRDRDGVLGAASRERQLARAGQPAAHRRRAAGAGGLLS